MGKGLIKIYDINILKEMKAYTNNDLQEMTSGLITRHFDLLMATCIAWQMKDYAVVNTIAAPLTFQTDKWGRQTIV